MTTKYRLAQLLVLIPVAFALGVPGQAQTVLASRPLIAFNIPPAGELGATATAACETLRAGGQCDLWALKVTEVRRQGQPIAVLVHDGTSPMPRELADLSDYVSSGGGLVLVVPTASKWAASHSPLTSLLDLQVLPAPNQGPQLTLRSHPVTAGLTESQMNPIGLRLQSTLLDPLISQGGQAIALAGMVGSGRVVVILAPLVASLDLARAPDPDRVKLLAQAAQWVADRSEPVIEVGSATDAETPLTQSPRVTLGARIVMDVPSDAAWQEVSAAVTEAAQRLGMPLDRLSYRPGSSTLAQAMAGYPAVVVVASYRELDDQERALAVQYVADGGALLALGSCRDGDTTKLTALNRLLAEFGISMTWARPGGEVKFRKHAATRDLPPQATAPPGCAVWAFSDWPLATGSAGDVATAIQVDRGRIVVMDAAALVADKAIPAASTQAFRQLLAGAMRWLAGK